MEEKKHRILLKISGEFLMGDLGFGIDVKTIDRIAGEIKSIYDDGYEICIVIGGGNIFRGISAASYGMHRAAADNIGMLATIMNSIAFQNSLEKQHVPARVMSAIAMPTICESYIRRKALRHLEKRRVLIFAAGSGNPYFTTDTAAAMRALETGCEVLIKATTVAGIYDSDPKKNPRAVLLKEVSYKDVLEKDIRVMDHTAITLTRENDIPIIVFSLNEEGSLRKVLSGEGNYSIIS
ncbi:MAG: UMP kinase [Holosporaceae bacterium]|jgi:uridylate kinase|nr:UMP kinase [Holosporaceae bacterium]